jgi:hypothetical protein
MIAAIIRALVRCSPDFYPNDGPQACQEVVPTFGESSSSWDLTLMLPIG